MSTVRVLVVDDSATMRALIAAVLHRDPAIQVVGQASNAMEARKAMKELDPDVVTLDIEMPMMCGLDFLDKIMRLRPTPVVMVSTLTTRGAAAAIEALERGAIECVAKPSSSDPDTFGELAAIVKSAAAAPVRSLSASRNGVLSAGLRPQLQSSYRPDDRLIAFGASTGGVEALVTVLSQFPENCPPTVVCQHMPAGFTRSFADRLDRLCAPKVAEAVDGAPLVTGRVYIAPGGSSHLEVAGAGQPWCRLRPGEQVNNHRPSVDVLFSSVASSLGPRALGVILTGMGKDGAAGLLAMRQAGAYTLGQDQATSIVYGMPKVASQLGAVARELPLHKLGSEILSLTTVER